MNFFKVKHEKLFHYHSSNSDFSEWHSNLGHPVYINDSISVPLPGVRENEVTVAHIKVDWFIIRQITYRYFKL